MHRTTSKLASGKGSASTSACRISTPGLMVRAWAAHDVVFLIPIPRGGFNAKFGAPCVAQVRLTVVSPGGSYEPTGAGAIAIPAGSANRIDLPSLSGVAGALVVTSTVPVSAAVIVPGGQTGAPGAMSAAAPALQEQGVLAEVGQHPDTTTLVLSAPGAAAIWRPY